MGQLINSLFKRSEGGLLLGGASGRALLDAGLALRLLLGGGLLPLCALGRLGAVENRLGADCLVGLLIDGLELVGVDAVLLVHAELLLVPLFVVFLGELHEVSDVLAVDAVSKGGLVVFLRLFVVVASGKAVAGVRDVKATVDSALESSEHVGASGGSVESDVQVALQRRTLLVLFVLEVLADLFVALVDLVEVELGEKAAGAQEAGAVCGRVIGETLLDTVFWELAGVGSGKDVVTVDTGGDDLAGDLLVRLADDETVLGRVILVFVLDDQVLALLVVGEAVTSPAELDLIARVIGASLLDFDPTHLKQTKRSGTEYLHSFSSANSSRRQHAVDTCRAGITDRLPLALQRSSLASLCRLCGIRLFVG